MRDLEKTRLNAPTVPKYRRAPRVDQPRRKAQSFFACRQRSYQTQRAEPVRCPDAESKISRPMTKYQRVGSLPKWLDLRKVRFAFRRKTLTTKAEDQDQVLKLGSRLHLSIPKYRLEGCRRSACRQTTPYVHDRHQRSLSDRSVRQVLSPQLDSTHCHPIPKCRQALVGSLLPPNFLRTVRFALELYR